MNDTNYTHAQFWKCALQVNPYGYGKTYRGQDHGLSAEDYAQALLEVCRRMRTSTSSGWLIMAACRT